MKPQRTPHICALSLLLLVCGGCGAYPFNDAAPNTQKSDSFLVSDFNYPLDDTLTLADMQSMGTHNSYHVAPSLVINGDWNYTHAPLAYQLAVQGVRHFEFDIHYSQGRAAFEVMHLPVLDNATVCRSLVECLMQLRVWSDANPSHQPIVILLEPKDILSALLWTSYFESLEKEILSIWPTERLITPQEVRGDFDDIATALHIRGWPALRHLRGRVMFALLDTLEFSNTYLSNANDTPLMFVAAPPSNMQASIALIDDPLNHQAAISRALENGMLVRTRADEDCREANHNDPRRLNAALTSGAQLISTDYPGPVQGIDYRAEIPHGTPSRCNPILAPQNCWSQAIEDLKLTGVQ